MKTETENIFEIFYNYFKPKWFHLNKHLTVQKEPFAYVFQNDVLKNFAIFTGKHVLESFFKK